jgi:microcompartment protein CcmK/EutM
MTALTAGAYVADVTGTAPRGEERMHLGRVRGNVVSSIKAEGLASFKLLLVDDVEPDGSEPSPAPPPYVAIDLAGAGDGEIVLVTKGSAARVVGGMEVTPTDAAVVGIVDSVQYRGQVTFVKR